MSEIAHPTIDETAQCGCGGASITVTGRIWSMFLCACTECQKMTGAGHSAVALASPDSVHVSGETRAFARPANSGATMTRNFCPTCGITLYAQTSRAPDALLLAVGLFGQTDWFKPTQVLFTRSHLWWDALPAALPHYETYRKH